MKRIHCFLRVLRALRGENLIGRQQTALQAIYSSFAPAARWKMPQTQPYDWPLVVL